MKEIKVEGEGVVLPFREDKMKNMLLRKMNGAFKSSNAIPIRVDIK